MTQGIVWQAFDSVRSYLSPKEKRESIWVFLLLIVSSLLDVFGLATLVPVIMAASSPGSVLKNEYMLWLYQHFNFTSERSFLLALIISVLAFFLIKNVFTMLINYQQVRFTARIALHVIDTQFRKYSNLPYWHFNNVGSSKLLYATVGAPQAYVNGVIRQLFVFFSESTIVAVIVLGILIWKPVLFLILGVVLTPSVWLTYRMLRHRSQQIGTDLEILRPISYGILSDLFVGFIELKLANKQQGFKARLLRNQESVQKLEATAYLYTLLPMKIIEMVAILAVVGIFAYSLFTDDAGSLIVIIGLFAAAAYRLMPSMNRLLTAMVTMKQHRYTIEDLALLRDYLKPQEEIKQVPLSFTRDITFSHLSFAFPSSEKLVLNDVNFTVRKGEKIGIIGSSGSGKTTLMNLLLRFYTEQQGHILVDGVPLAPENLQAWYKTVGYVKQDTFLMEASLQDNITLQDEHVDADRLNYALEQASLSEFVKSLPNGVQTLAGERGSRLSGGQRQRIGIARALYKNADVLILDEATSALDNETEREVSEAISKLAHTDITVFIIAHRITTLRECDRIYELKNGEVVAEHQYADLIQAVI